MGENHSSNTEPDFLAVDVSFIQRRKAIYALLAVTLVWGATFIWMKQALDNLDPQKAEFGKNGVVAVLVAARFAIATLVMVFFFPKARSALLNKQLWKDGILLGLVMFFAYVSQMIGLDDIDPSVSAFLTSLYVIFTALLTTVLTKSKPSRIMIAGVALATFGAGFIQGPPHLSWGLGEVLTVICAAIFAIHIILTQKITLLRDPIGISTTSFAVATISSIIMVFLVGEGSNTEQWSLVTLDGVLIPVILLGIGGTFFCLLLLNLYQRFLHPVQAAIIYAFEPVWATAIGLGLDMVEWSLWIAIGGGSLFIGNIMVEAFGTKLEQDEEE
jgi:drug/metabolite transporter (DMT)-like permease